MDFDEAIFAHSDWKRKLRLYLSKVDHSLTVADVAAADDRCKLGEWIAGEGRKYSALPEFATLSTQHTRFHKAAADIVEKADRGQDVSGELVPASNSEFSRASTSVVRAIIEMKKRAGAVA
ncbi:MAG TPA: CZB domain-containing protein [Terriglobales bacterium]